MVKAIQKARNNVVQKQNQNELTQWLEARSVWASQEAVHLKMERWVIQANPRTRLLEESANLSITYQMFMTLYEERYRNMLGNILGGQYW